MKYTNFEVLNMAKHLIGAPVVLLELDPLSEETAIKQAYAKYTEYFSAWRYVIITASYTQRVYDITIPPTIATYIDESVGVILSGQKTGTFSLLNNVPVNKGSVVVTVGTITATDNSLGVLSGTGVATGSTINYMTGKVRFSLSSSAGADTPVTVSYSKIVKEGLEVLNVVEVQQLPQYQPNFWNQWGLLDVRALRVSDLMVLPMEYYKTVQILQETSQILGTITDWEFYDHKLYLRSFQNSRMGLKCKVETQTEDIKDTLTSRFIDLVTGYLKISVGHVRRKYPTIPVPGAEMQLDGEAFIQEGYALIKDAEDKFTLLQNKPVFVIG